MNAVIHAQITELHSLCKEFKVKKLYAFGSVCTASFPEDSDIDMIVAFKTIPVADYADYFFGFKHQLQILFGRNVDLITEKSLQNPYFIKVVNKTKTPIYEG